METSNDDDDDDSDNSDQEEEKVAAKKRKRAIKDGQTLVQEDSEELKVKYDGTYKNKQRVLVFCSRGVTARYRHLLEDIRKLVPHHKKDVKLDSKGM